MQIAKNFWNQPVVTHGVEHTALSHQHNQDHRTEAGKDRNGNACCQPAISGHVLRNGIRNGCFTSFGRICKILPVGNTGQYMAK